MGMVAPITGRKSGDEGHTPVESPNDLLSTSHAKILLALGEGEWEGSIDGSMIYLNSTPLIDSNGNENFPGTKWDFRPGSVQQTYIKGIPSVENELTINTELKSDNSWVRWLTNSMLSAIRLRLRWPALQQQKENGDVVGYSIDYSVEIATDGGSYKSVLTTSVTGKTNTSYERSHRIDLPTGSSWQIRVRRSTPNQNKNTVSDAMFISAITEVVDAKFSYPNTALLYVEFDASQFNNIPSVAVKAKMRKVRVPTNYDPISRTYAGMWDGSFKIAWTNNPAWISYDLILDDRFGTGQRITANLVDKWELYLIAQYCDELVPNGKGDMEPRYTCDIYIQEAKEAWQVLRDLAAIYRGMTYWANGQMYTVADMPRDMDFLYTNANVIAGEFSYTGTSVRSKFTRALVSWDNPDNEYNTDVTSTGDVALQRRYGDNPIELSAIGCTRESEAQRRGKWAIYTNNNNRMVSFSVGLDGQIPLPGAIIGVADKLIAGKRIGGRISAVDGVSITLDKAPDTAVNDRLIVNLPSGKAEARTITAVDGNVITVSTEYSETPASQLQWAIESASLAPQLFRVMAVSKADSDEIEYQISGIEYNPGKFPAIDNGSQLLERPISTLPPKTQLPPAEVTIAQRTYIEQAQSVTVMIIEWPKAANAIGYDVEWRKDSGEWVTVPRTGATSVEIIGVYTGNYLARVRAVNSVNVASIPRESILTAITGKQGQLETVNSLTTASKVFGIQIDWTFPPASGDTLNTEIRYSLNANGSNPVILGQFAYPLNTHTMAGLAAGAAYFFSARLVDKSGNVSEWSEWVLGQSSSNADEILGYLTNQISESQLAQELLDPIQQIPSIKLNADKVNPLQAQVDQVQSQLAEIVGAGDWDPETAYNIDDLVKYNGALYRAKVNVPAGTVPTNTSYWDKVGDYSSLGEFVTAISIRVDDVETSIDDITGELTNQAQSIDGIYAQVNPPMAGDVDWNAGNNIVLAGVWSERYARAINDEALSKRIDVVLASVNGNAASIQQESIARVNADEALAQDITTLSASMSSNAAAIQQESIARANADSALSQQITTVQAKANDNYSAVQQTSQALANLDGELQAMWKVSLGVTQDGKYYAAGFGISYENGNQGLQSNFYVLADRFAILNKATGSTTITTPFVVENGQVFMNSAFIGELQNKTVIQRVGGSLQVFGVGFGNNNQFMEWYGPDVGDISNCTEANATTYRKIDGSAYYGGALSAGILKTGVTNPDKNFYIVNSYPVEIGPYSHNGNPKNIVVSFTLSASYSSTSQVSNPTQPSLGWRLERRIGNGVWATVSSGTFHGITTVSYNAELRRYTTEEWCGSSSTFIDNYSGDDDLSYRVKVLSFSRYHSVSNVSSQRLSLVSTEE
jgi:predicted phage tail protein